MARAVPALFFCAFLVLTPEGGSTSRTEYGVRMTLVDGDLVLIRDGYHPVVAAYGYDVCYRNVLAGSARSMAASDDPRYAHLRTNVMERDPRVPLVTLRNSECHS